MTKEISIIENVNALEVFQSEEKVEDVLSQIRAKVADFVPDMTTDKGRKEIAALAYKIARSKTYLDNAGKDLASDWKAKVKVVDASRKKFRDELDALKDQVRKPLTDWEEAEKSRVAKLKESLEWLQSMADVDLSQDLDAILFDISKVDTSDWSEFKAAGDAAKAGAIAILEKKIAEKEEVRRAAEAAEKARIEAEAKARAEREAQIAKEAAEKAKREAEEKAAREAAEAQRKAAEEKARIEAEKKAAEEAKIAAEKAAKEAEERAKREAELAAQRERERIEAEKKAEADAAAKREANKKHRAKINNEALDALVAAGLTQEMAMLAVRTIAKNEVPHVTISY